MIRSKAIRQAARGHECTMRTPLCDNNTETTVAAHSNWAMHGKGMGVKSECIFVAFACYKCHHWLDTSGADKCDRMWYWMRGHAETLRRLVEMGIIKIVDYDPNA